MMMKGNTMQIDSLYGSKILNAYLDMDQNQLVLVLEPDLVVRLWDNAAYCCEQRYMSTDDNLSELIGNRLTKLSIKSAVNVNDDDYDMHDVAFLEIATDGGFATMMNHNIHNGYYAGWRSSWWSTVNDGPEIEIN